MVTIQVSFLASPNKRCKQEADTPSPESPKKPAKRRKLSVSKKKTDKVDNQIPAYNNQQTAQPNMMMSGAGRNDTQNMTGLLMKDYAIKVKAYIEIFLYIPINHSYFNTELRYVFSAWNVQNATLRPQLSGEQRRQSC